MWKYSSELHTACASMCVCVGGVVSEYNVGVCVCHLWELEWVHGFKVTFTIWDYTVENPSTYSGQWGKALQKFAVASNAVS